MLVSFFRAGVYFANTGIEKRRFWKIVLKCPDSIERLCAVFQTTPPRSPSAHPEHRARDMVARMAGRPDGRTAGWPDGVMARRPDGQKAGWPDGQMASWAARRLDGPAAWRPAGGPGGWADGRPAGQVAGRPPFRAAERPGVSMLQFHTSSIPVPYQFHTSSKPSSKPPFISEFKLSRGMRVKVKQEEYFLANILQFF